ncbi:MAG TPA: hypothetical protein VF438_02605 [Candidatus Paceibacterota bacterium]
MNAIEFLSGHAEQAHDEYLTRLIPVLMAAVNKDASLTPGQQNLLIRNLNRLAHSLGKLSPPVTSGPFKNQAARLKHEEALRNKEEEVATLIDHNVMHIAGFINTCHE